MLHLGGGGGEGGIISTLGGVQYIIGIPWVHRRDTMGILGEIV